jgi:hypothetical protein
MASSMWSQRIQFTPEEEAMFAVAEERLIAASVAAGGVEHLPWTAEQEAVIGAACAQLRAEWEAESATTLRAEEQVLRARRRASRASRRRRMVLDAVRRSTHLR